VNFYLNPLSKAKFGLTRGLPPDISVDQFMRFLWNDGDDALALNVDGLSVVLHPSRILCVTYMNAIKLPAQTTALKSLWFNREFYCVHTFDSEVSCNGLLFFGSNNTPVVQLDTSETIRLRTLFGVLEEEFTVRDINQEEMLRILLKRFIIRCTRLARKQLFDEQASPSDIDLIRQFSYLVEEHYRTRKTVAEYASLMHRSPKTITNVFSKFAADNALQVIHNRVVMEARRMLLYTDAPAKEIAWKLGYEDPAQFSKLFKKHAGLSPTDFRNSNSDGHIGHY